MLKTGKIFNVTADCKPRLHYMVNIKPRLVQIKEMVDAGDYFTINRSRQYGKTTTLRLLSQYLQEDYHVVFMDFQMFGADDFKNENVFSLAFSSTFLRILRRIALAETKEFQEVLMELKQIVIRREEHFVLRVLFEYLSELCATSDKPIVLMIDEVDSATNNQVFLDFLAQLRAYYIDRDVQPTFQSVILAGVYDVKNLRRKLRSQEDHKMNSPWNIAADFHVDMSLSEEGIAEMLQEYEDDHHTGMEIPVIARLLVAYTAGYPFLVSRLCKFMDEEVWKGRECMDRSSAWTKEGFQEAVRMLLSEQNMLFESLSEKLSTYPELNQMLRTLLFTGKNIVYNIYEPVIHMATMFGFVKNQNGNLAVANRIFDTWLYNFYLSSAKMQGQEIYKASLQDRSQFVVDGKLNMRRVLEKFVVHFHDLYGDYREPFIEDEGRKLFLLYLRPIINGTGNYYIEARTRGLRRTDVIVDYHGDQYVIEMKIWHGDEYNHRGEQQLVGYLEDYHVNKGYLLSFNFNQKKEIGVREIVIGDKSIVEAVV